MMDHFKRYSGILLILGLGILIGILLWDVIELPYHNPQEVVGVLSDLKHNPNTDVVRYLVFILIPVILLGMLYVIWRKRLPWLFATSKQTVTIEDDKHFHSSNRWLIVAIIGVLILASHFRYLNNSQGASSSYFMDHFHDGEATAAAVAYENDGIPYRDFYVARGMLQDPLKVLASFELFGRQQTSVRILESLMTIVTFITLGGLFILMFGRNYLAATLLTAIYCLSLMIDYFAPTRLWYRDIFCILYLIGLLLILREVQREKKSTDRFRVGRFYTGAFLLGLLPCFGFAWSLDRGFFTTAIVVLTWPVLYFIHLRRNPVRVKFLLASVIGFAAGFLILGFSLKWALGDMFRYAFIQMPGYKEYVDGLEFAIRGYGLKAGLYRVYILALHALVFYWLAYRYFQFLFQSAEGFWITTREFVRRYLFEIAFVLLAIIVFRYALGRADRYHIATASAYHFMFLLYVFVKYYIPRITPHSLLRKLILAGMIVILCGTTALNGYHFISRDVIAHAYPSGKTDMELLAEDYQELVLFLRPIVNKDAQFVTLTNEASLYYLLNQPSPLVFAEIWFGTTKYFQQEMVNELETKPVKYILYQNDAIWNEIDGVSNKRRAPILFDYVERHFEPYKKIKSHDIWIRKGSVETQQIESTPPES